MLIKRLRITFSYVLNDKIEEKYHLHTADIAGFTKLHRHIEV